MSNTKIYVIGTTHSSNKSKIRIKKAFKKYKFDIVLSEGVGGIENKMAYWLKEPFLMIITQVYLLILAAQGSEFSLLAFLAKKHKIIVNNMDKSFSELINYFHRQHNYIIFLLIFIILIFFLHKTPNKTLILITAYVFAEIVYFFYFVLNTGKIRNTSFFNKIDEAIKKGKHKNILVVCGRFHANCIKRKFNVIDLSKIN